MGIVLNVENVSIRYITGDFKDIGLKEYTIRRLTHNYNVKEFMAVESVSFQLEQGDMLGIIGSNGAGKSTLLKAVAGIMEPTQGKITANGDIAALLELGSGFDGDLTVRENAYLRGAMLGYTREFMDETYERIIDFAELKEFEDRPFKQLSSGMKSRLAFSIASLVKPDILILDEVLSVGDGAFQEKSAKKMREIISQGATTILVSHSLNQIRELCNKVLWLDHGRQVVFGETQEICDRYEAFLSGELALPENQTETRESGEETLTRDSMAASDPPKRIGMRGILACMLLAMFFATLTTNLGQRYLEKTRVSRVEITAQEGGGLVIFRGAFVNENWVSPAGHVPQDGGWLYNVEQDVYTAVNGGTLTFLLPAGGERKLVFYAGPDAGKVSVNLDGEPLEFDLRNETVEELGITYQVPDFSIESMPVQLLTIALISFLCSFGLYWILIKRLSSPMRTEREVWLDALKVISAFMVVLIHTAGNVYNNSYGVNETLWMQGLWANAVPRFAVPCFLMITGALNLTKHYDFKKTWEKVLHILIPLIFWSTLHILHARQSWMSDLFARLMRMPFEHQDASLWYAYQLIWLYLGMPFWAMLWDKLTSKKRWAFVVFSLGIPGILTYLEELMALNVNEYLPFTSVNPMICYVGMLFVGRLLYEVLNTMNHKNTLLCGISCAAIGLALTVASSVYVSKLAGQSVHTFFSEVRITGVIYGAGVFLCFGSLKGLFLHGSDWMKRTLYSLSGISLGVYMIHTLLIYKILPQTILFMGISWNRNASLWQLLVCVLVYYGISVAVCLLISKIPFARRLVR